MKLVDESGFLLGTFTLPQGMMDVLERREFLQGYTDMPPVDISKAYSLKDMTRRVWTLYPYSGAPPFSPHYVLSGIELSEFEALRYVEFSPSLAYVLKLISDFPR